MFFKKQLRRLCTECEHLSTMRLYLYLSGKQTYNNYVMIAPSALMQQLKMSKAQFYRSINWLKEHEYVRQVNVEGNVGWLLNPNWTGCGAKSLQERQKLWALTANLNKALKRPKEVYDFEFDDEGCTGLGVRDGGNLDKDNPQGA